MSKVRHRSQDQGQKTCTRASCASARPSGTVLRPATAAYGQTCESCAILRHGRRRRRRPRRRQPGEVICELQPEVGPEVGDDGGADDEGEAEGGASKAIHYAN